MIQFKALCELENRIYKLENPKTMNETPNAIEVLKQELEATMKRIESLTETIVKEKEQARRLIKAIRHLEN